MTEAPDPLDAAMDAVTPPASDLQGDPGHDKAVTLSKAAQLMRDRALGFTYAELAHTHGYADASGARQALIRALEARVTENASTLRQIENDRYEMDQRALRIIIGNPETPPALRIKAIDSRTRSAAAHRRLNGLDAPIQVAISAGVAADLDDALQELAEVIHGEVLGREDDTGEPERLEG